MQRLNQKGDTIVEVLISVAIVGLMLTGAFAISNASYRQIRMAQERSEAQRIAQSAVELLDTGTAAKKLTEGPSPAPFCILPDLTTPVAAATECNDQGGLYDVSIKRAGDAGGSRYTFVVTVTWDGLSGRQEQLSVDYRVGRMKV